MGNKHTHLETILLNHLCTGYDTGGKRHIVGKDLSGAICQGHLTCLIGANGAGKTTLLHTLCGFLHPLGGSVQILGKELKAYKHRELAKTISVVLTEKNSLRNMTVRGMVELGRSPYTGFWGRLESRDHEVVIKALEDVGMDTFAHRMMHTLSDGEAQKVMIAKALAQETPIIFLDEPMAFLDFPSKVEMMQLLLRLARNRQKTIFMSTHDLELALQLADRVWMLDKEQGLSIGAPEDLALDGTLGKFYTRKGICFDQESGLFRINNSYRYAIRLEGRHGKRYAMVRKAFLRNEIRSSMHELSEVKVVISDQHTSHPYCFFASEQDGGIAVSTIEELVNVVLHHLQGDEAW